MNQQLSRVDQLKQLLLPAQRQITSLLQDDAKAKKFMAASLVVASNPALNRCSPDSIVQALIGVAMSNLNIDSNIGHCYLVPYGDKVQLQIGYKGFIQLLFRAGWMVKALPVYKCDEFSMSFDGWNNNVAFSPDIDERDEGDKEWVYQNLRGIYVVARHADTKDEYSTFVNKTVIEKLRMNSPNQKSAQKPIGIWADWYVEMAQSKAVKKLAKILPIGDSRAVMAIAADDKAEMGKPIDYKKTTENMESTGIIIEMNAHETSLDSQEETLATVIAAIDSASTQQELDVLLPSIESLGKNEKNTARSSWTRKASSIKVADKSMESKRSGRIDPETEPNWQANITACKTQQELLDLLGKMPEEYHLKHDELIDTRMDFLKSLSVG